MAVPSGRSTWSLEDRIVNSKRVQGSRARRHAGDWARAIAIAILAGLFAGLATAAAVRFTFGTAAGAEPWWPALTVGALAGLALVAVVLSRFRGGDSPDRLCADVAEMARRMNGDPR